MDKYLVFLGERFYPLGGWSDFFGAFDSFQEAQERIFSIDPEDKWCDVVFRGEIVCEGICANNDKNEKVWDLRFIIKFTETCGSKTQERSDER